MHPKRNTENPTDHPTDEVLSDIAFHFDVQQVQVSALIHLMKNANRTVSLHMLAEAMHHNLLDEGDRALLETALRGLCGHLVEELPSQGYRLMSERLPEAELLVKAHRMEKACPGCQCTSSWPCQPSCPGGENCHCPTPREEKPCIKS